MFGSTSTWGANNQQNQQQQPSAFGQQSAFGAPAFGGGGTGAFGQPQQQQPQANPMFGNLNASTSNNTGGFGAFGATNTAQTNAVNPMFGGAKPAAGFGAFGGGGSNAFGGGGAFGQNNTGTQGTGAFGQPASNNSSAFGQTNPMFGKPAATAFGAPAANNATGSYDNVPVVSTGSSNPPYAPFSEKDPAAANVTNNYQSISCMPAYRGTSFEELRLQDYAQGRKTAGAFGQSAAFGGVQQPTTSIFGQAQPAQQTSVFGGGATQPTSGFGAFGNPAPAAATPAFGGGAFGQPQQQQQQQQQQPAQGFGGFGQQPQQQQSSVFGGGTTGAFGNTTAKPAFGAFGGGGTAFGANNNANPLGGNTQQPAQPSLFGNNTAQPTTGFGGFGNTNNNNAPKPGLFGQTPAQPTQNAFGGSNLFGGNQQQQAPAQQPSTGFGFGTNNNAQQQQPANPNPLFGGGGNTNPLFGGGNAFGNNNQQQQQQQQQPSLFGAKPNNPLFPTLGSTPNNNAPAPTPGLFGNSLGQQGNQQSTFGTGIFGNANKPLAPTLGQSNSMGQSNLFGGFNNTNTTFTASASNGAAQGTLTASIAQPIATDLFSMLPPGPHAVNLEQSTKKKVPFFVDVPTRSPIPRVGLSYTPAGSKLRGFGASTATQQGSPGNPFAFANMSLTNGKPGVLSLSRGLDSPDSILRSSSPSLGSGSRHSVKKLILDKKVEPAELFNKSGGPGSPGAGRGRITFSPALSIAAREKEAAAAQTRPLDSPTPAPRAPANRFTAQNTQNALQAEADGSANPEEGEYWVRPDLATLRQAGYEKLSSFKDLVVGRVGYGEIHFLEPVDLTGLPKLGALLGQVVRFDDKECSVYPDSDEVDKPPPGSGLNVRAQLSLLRCWAVDKATREPVKDASHPAAVKHLKRLKNMKDTHFEGFDIARGEWTFTVDHF